MIELKGKYNTAKIFTDIVDESSVSQIIALCNQEFVSDSRIRMMPDVHAGVGCTIGTTMTIKDKVVPNLVGVDIGCGMETVRIREKHFEAQKLDKLIREKIPSGFSVRSNAHRYIDEAELGGLYCAKRFDLARAEKSIGTLGGGNHFIEIQKSDAGKVWLMIHSGSRNLGKRIEEFYHNKARKLNERYHVKLADPELAFLPIQEEAGHNYFRDMLFALRYARENRRRMMNIMKSTFLEFVPETAFLREIDIHHNYAAFEEHFGEKLCIHRKGATSAKSGELGIIPGSMGTASYIVRGLGNPESFMSCSHGAGRRMSRIAACTGLSAEECDRAMAGIVCERWKPYRKHGKAKGVLDLSEAPQAYKAIDEVIVAELDLIEPQVRLTPLAVLKG